MDIINTKKKGRGSNKKNIRVQRSHLGKNHFKKQQIN
jgi:hypothetical protein